MGNEGKKTSEKFYQTCHRGMVGLDLEKEQDLLVNFIRITEDFVEWRKRIDPFFQKKHLLMPCKLEIHDNITEFGCCALEDFHKQ